jgi:hypothetical protein
MNRREFMKSSGVAGLSLGAPRVLYGKGEAAASTPEGGSSLKVGFAERDITPDPGMEVPGSYVKEREWAIHDPCKVRAVVFDDGRSRVALVGLDALIVPRYVVLAARRIIHERCGILPDAVLISASHNHSAGPVGMVQPGQYDDASALVKRLAYEVSSDADAGYVERVREEIVTAVCHANSCRVEARCGFGVGNEGKVSFNRRLRMKNGLTYTHPGQGNLPLPNRRVRTRTHGGVERESGQPLPLSRSVIELDVVIAPSAHPQCRVCRGGKGRENALRRYQRKWSEYCISRP